VYLPGLDYNSSVTDYYTLEDGEDLGEINYVQVFSRAKTQSINQNADGDFYILCDLNGSTVNSDNFAPISNKYEKYRLSLFEKPGGGSWTWNDVDNLKIGVDVYSPVIGGNYPEVRITQMYAVIEYQPDEITLELPQPMNLNMNHSRKTNRYTFPDGGYEVEDMGRQGKTITLNGYIYDKDTSVIYEKAQSIADMVHYRSAVSLSGMTDPNFNKEYYIKDFNYEQRGGEPYLYKWALILEES